ncbi:ketose-bisphosphate aldolase [Paenibacillus allorhizosphaerae]|uniref:Fructose-bisphosphate aldolase n=1 Tax=Paenibacillus allorhizosphaerae TaxID=2849866 RepID=A0ABM8VAC9_9BACL|nr:class II fructose-bisphosphate aldolase [Paenibacillus allorhizosphaerae]CAG7616118.1 Fructose-bisphosphate aldolase [Paenibacillus allorhizosphaerae]
MRRFFARELLDDAMKRKYAVGAFSAHTAEMVQGIIEAADEQRSPVIIQIGQRAIRNSGFGALVNSIRWHGSHTDVPVVVHLDHGKSYEQAIEAIQAGCTSVMYDGSHHDLDENITVTREVVRAGHAAGVPVEGELGKIPGVEDDLAVDDRDAFYTNPEQALHFWQETQVDSLAVAIGSAHGLYKSKPELDMERLKKISALTNIPIVLHGGSGIPDDQIRQAVANGIAKINVDTELRSAYTQGVREALEQFGDAYDVFPFARTGAERMKRIVVDKMRLFGSAGKA